MHNANRVFTPAIQHLKLQQTEGYKGVLAARSHLLTATMSEIVNVPPRLCCL